ncbi:mechanosensitive ion channel [Hellea sp.]|nr:mechanosensitive ion channel [Hellea sp.]
MAQDATDAVTQTTQGVTDAAGMFTPDKLMGYWTTAQPVIINLIFAILILWIGMKIARFAGNLVRKMVAKNGKIDDTLGNFFASIVKYIVTAFVVIAAITKLGVETASLVAMLGAATLAIGLALQGTLGNVAAGVMLMLFRPYKLGDYVGVAGEEGVVTDLNIFTTQLSTIDNVEVIIANGEAWGSTIKNFTSMGVRRVDVDYGIHYDDDIDKAIKIITDTASAHPDVLTEPAAPWAKVVLLNESSVDIQSRAWCRAEHYWDVMFDLNKSIKEAFDKGGITIPYPTSIELDG